MRRSLVRRDGYDEIQSIIHLAAYYNFSGQESDLYEKLTVEGTRRVLRFARQTKVRQFLFSSSMLVHKPSEPGLLIAEDSPLEATWAYPQSKIDAERVIEAERGDIPAVALRVAAL